MLLEKQGSTTTATYTYGNALIRKDGETPLFDGQGSERTVTNSSQTVTGTLTQDGFGNTVATTGSSTNPYMYAATSGYRNDGDAGLSHVGATNRPPALQQRWLLSDWKGNQLSSKPTRQLSFCRGKSRTSDGRQNRFPPLYYVCIHR